VSSFNALPFVLQVNFVYLNCLCAFDLNGDGCCAGVNIGGINTAGTGPGETPTEIEKEYLNVVCSDTQASIDFAIEEGLPTKRPTSSTLAPVTAPPTTKKPSMEPTTVVSPSKKPTEVPASPSTSSPVVAPTPTTIAPVISPTSAPTESTGQPTLSPSLFVDVPTTIKPTLPTTLKPTSVQVPTTIKPTAPSTKETPSPTFQFQPSMNPSTGATTNLGKKPDNGDTTFEPIAPGAVAGIVLACVGVALVGVLVTSRKRKRDRMEDPSLGDLSDKDRDLEAGVVDGKGPGDEDDSPGGGEPMGSDSSHLSSLGGDDDDEDMEVGNYIPQTREPSPPRDPALVPIVAGIPSSPRSQRRHVDSNDDSSSAGASGWSSSAGMSSLNTASLADASLASASFDTGVDDGLSTGSHTKALAAIAAASAIVETTRVTQNDSEPVFIPLDGSTSTEDDVSSPNSPVGIHSTPQGEVSRADLDKAIEAGDWSAVGATAALLAVTSKSSSKFENESQQGSRSSSSISRDGSSNVDDASNSKELDDLVAAGDWEGVVLAAAKIEEGRSDANRSFDEDTTSSGYTGGSKGDRDLSEIRSEVELLVRRVVPDEVDNIDEMMLQFKGREEELVETLRTMQERTVAQRARQAIRKSAKMEAKARALENREEQRNRTNSLSSEDPSFYEDSEEDSSVSDLDSQGMSMSEDQPSSKQPTITSLERAVKQGDWRAVGEAAAMMGGAGIASTGGDGDSEASSYAETDSHQGSGSLHDSSLATSTVSSDDNKEARITHLDDLIAKGDWSGIVAAAGKYQAIDEQMGLASEEEREALAEAQMWKTIATHSKSESFTTGESAAAATNWAISRSLEQIQNVTGPTTEDDESV
jgi:hypothetical protein